MKALQTFNLVTLLIAVTFAVLLAVVCLMYAVHLDSAPRLRHEWPLLLRTTLVFWALSAVAAAAWTGVRRGAAWRWPAQLALAAVLAGAGGYLFNALS